MPTQSRTGSSSVQASPPRDLQPVRGGLENGLSVQIAKGPVGANEAAFFCDGGTCFLMKSDLMSPLFSIPFISDSKTDGAWGKTLAAERPLWSDQ